MQIHIAMNIIKKIEHRWRIVLPTKYYNKYYTVVSWTKGLRDIGRTISNVTRKPKCRQAEQCIVGPSIEKFR